MTKTGLIIITASLLCLTAFMPTGLTSDMNDSTAIAYWPDEGGAYPQDAHATGAITYNTGSDGSGSEPGSGGGSTAAPLKILAIWETGCPVMDADTTLPGCQIDPPMEYGGYSIVRVFVAVEDPDDVLPPENGVKIDISWPDNGLYRDLGFGGIPSEWDNLEPVMSADWYLHYLPAHGLDVGLNQPYICYYDGAFDGIDLEGYEYLEWAFGENNLKLFYVEFQLYYCDPAGCYDVHVAVQGPSVDQQMNYFEYDMGIGVEIDFDYINWGTKIDINKWYDYDGNWQFDPTEESYLGVQRPTIRNIGNWDAALGVIFGNGDFDPNYVLFDVRVGNSNPVADKYNVSMREALGIDGLLPNTAYSPLPVDNSLFAGDEERNDVLLKCHTAKMDFYLNPLQWNQGEGLYEFPITIFVNPPAWEPGPCIPCEGPKVITFPSEPITMSVVHEPEGAPSYFDTTLSNVPVGYASPNPDSVWNGHWLGWCVDRSTLIPDNVEYDVILWCTYDPAMPFPDTEVQGFGSSDWDMVNYIINHKNKISGATNFDIQDAIWYFIGGNGWNPTGNPEAMAIISDALANGEGYRPGPGEWLAVLCEAVNPEVAPQWTIIEVDP